MSEAVANQRVLVFHLLDGSFAAGLGPQGIERLPPSVPALWVTVPTLEEERLGFALNGDFDVDVGRASVSRATPERNANLAGTIGEELGECLCGLLKAASGEWDSLRSQLGLADTATWESFAESLWEVFATPLGRPTANADKPVLRLAHAALWGHQQRAWPLRARRRLSSDRLAWSPADKVVCCEVRREWGSR